MIAADSGAGLREFLAGGAARDAEMARSIWEYAEVGYQETKSTALLQQELTKAGFKIEAGVAGIPTAFVATAGSGKPVIGILAEYDALPGIRMDYLQEGAPPLNWTAVRTISRSSQPTRRVRPVVAAVSANFWYTSLSVSWISVGSGPAPTRVVYALVTAMTFVR